MYRMKRYIDTEIDNDTSTMSISIFTAGIVPWNKISKSEIASDSQVSVTTITLYFTAAQSALRWSIFGRLLALKQKHDKESLDGLGKKFLNEENNSPDTDIF